MAIYDLGTASLAANGEVTGAGTTWKAPLTLIRVGATIVFKTEPVQIYTISEIISDTQINVYNPKSETVPAGTGYAILAHDGITVQGLAQDVAETLRYYQSRETEVADAVDAFNNFDSADFESKVAQVNTQHGDVVTIGAQVSIDADQVSQDKQSSELSASSAYASAQQAAASAASVSGAIIGTFQDGVTIESKSQQVINISNGNASSYLWAGALPKVVPAGSTPESTGGVSSDAWIPLSGFDDGFNYAELRSYSGSSSRVYVYGKISPFDGGDGFFEADINDASTEDDGGTVIVSASGVRYKRVDNGVAMLEWWEGANINDEGSDCLSAWDKFAASDVYSRLRLRSGTYRFSYGITTVPNKQKYIEGQGVWKTILQFSGSAPYGIQAFETIVCKNFQIRRVNDDGIVEEPGFGSGIGSGFRAANSLSSSAYSNLEQIFVVGHFLNGFEINAVSGTYINCNAYNTKGDGFLITGGSNHLEKCWAEHNSGRAFTINGIGNQLFQCYEEQNGKSNQSLSQVYISGGSDNRIVDFNYNPRNSEPLIPVFDCNSPSTYISAVEEVAVDAGKIVCSFSRYCSNSHYDGRGLISGGVIGGYPSTYNQNKCSVYGISNPGGGLIPSNKSIITSSQLINVVGADQVFTGGPGGLIPGATGSSPRESSNAWNLLYPGSNLNIYSIRITTLSPGMILSFRFFNQGFESGDLIVTDGTVKTFTLKGSGLAPVITGSTSSDSYLGIKMLSGASSSQGYVSLEIEYSYS